MNRPKTQIARSLCVLAFLAIATCVVSAQITPGSVDFGVNPLRISRVASAGWQFLKLPTDARSAAMGGTRSAVGYGSATSAFNNPASAVDVRSTDVAFSSMQWVADIQMNTISVVHNLGPLMTVGVHAIYLDYGDMVRTKVAPGVDALGNDIGIVPITQGLGTFSAHDLAVGVLVARQVTDVLQVGATVRYVEQQIDDAKMPGWAFDIGTLYWTGLGSLRISMLGKNFGPDGEYQTYEGRLAQSPAQVRMPMYFILGAAYDLLTSSVEFPHRLTVAAEYLKPNDGPDKVHVGAEYVAFANISLRGGYRFNYDEQAFTFGIGAAYAIDDDIWLQANYAYADLGRFDGAHMLTVGFGF